MTDTLPFRQVAVPSSHGERLVRDALFVVTFLLVWITTTPFVDLADSRLVEGATDGNAIGQLATLVLTAALAIFVMRQQPHVLVKAVTPILVLTLAWFALSAVLSNYPDLAIRRVVLTSLTIFQAVVFLLLAPGREDFGRLLGICSLLVLALCYAGVALAPHLSIHQFGDIREPGLAGSWRGAFEHKNGAGACMGLLIFLGIFSYRTWNRWAGALIVVLAGVFLIFTQAKSPLRLLPIVLLVVWLLPRVRNPLAAVPLLLIVPALIALLTIGSVLFEPIRDLLDSHTSDPSFTGRDEIWSFSIDQTLLRPIAGHGFQAFWGTSELIEAWNPQESWGYRASDAHNGFLNLAVMTGFVGLALALVWILVQPMVDYIRGRTKGAGDPALTALFLQIWLFGLCLAGFESVFFAGGSAHWFMIVASIIGLRFQNAFQLRR